MASTLAGPVAADGRHWLAGLAALACLALLAGCGDETSTTAGKTGNADAGDDLPDGGGLADGAGGDAGSSEPDAGPPDTGPGDIWGWVGDTKGGQFIQLQVPGDPNTALHGCATGGTKKAYIAGTDGTILGYDGLGWKVLTEGVFATLNAVAAAPGGLNAFAAGMGGTVIQAVAPAADKLGTQWGPPGGCSKSSDCDKNAPACTYAVCESGVCKYAPSGGPGCCGGVNFGDGFKNLSQWQVVDIYAKTPNMGGVYWQAAGVMGADGKPRYTSAPKALYFGQPDAKCPDDPDKTCPSFDNGKVVASTATSAPVDVPKADKVLLTFQLFMDTEAGLQADSLTLRVVKAGYPTKTLWDKNKLDGGGSTDGKFLLQTVDLSEYSGSKIELEFHFDSKDAFINGGEGVYIDDLLLKTTCAAGSSSGKGLTKATFFDVFAADDDHAWAVGADGAIARWLAEVSADGSEKKGSWSMMTGDASKDVLAIGGVPGVLQLAVGQSGMIAEISPSGLTPMTNATKVDLRGIAVTDKGKGEAHAVAVGVAGTALEWVGNKWIKATLPGFATLEDVTALGASVYLAIGGNQVFRRNASGSWQNLGTVAGKITAVDRISASEAIAVGEQGLVVRINGGTLQPEPGAMGSLSAADVHVVAKDDIWAVGYSGTVAHYDGKDWQGVKSAAFANLNGVWAWTTDDVWAVGLAGTIMHWDGEKWTLADAPKLDYVAVWGSDQNDVYAAASGGLVARFDGKAWKLLVAPVEGNLRAVWASGPNDIWAVGEMAAIFHSTGGGWAPVTVDPFEVPEGDPIEVEATLQAIWGSGPDDIWAAGLPDGNGGVLVHYDGKSWKYVPAMKDETRVFRAIWGWGPKDVLFAGTQGMLYHFDGEEFSLLNTGHTPTFYDVCGYGKDALIVGSFGTVLRFIPPPKPKDEGDAGG